MPESSPLSIALADQKKICSPTVPSQKSREIGILAHCISYAAAKIIRGIAREERTEKAIEAIKAIKAMHLL